MADTIQTVHQSGVTLYYQVRNTSGQVYNTNLAAFETYNASNWSDYDHALTEQGSSGVYVGNFQSGLTGGLYGYLIFEQVAGSVAEGDPGVAGGDAQWDGSAFQVVDDLAAIVAAAVLTTPAQPIATNASGEVVASNTAAIGTAVWATGTRTLTSFGTLVADVATAVWAAGTRTLTSFGSIIADIITAVWTTASPRTLTAFGFTPTTANGPTIVATTNKLEDMLELNGGLNRWTELGLAQAPSGGDATEAKQDTAIAAIAALNDLAVADIETAVQGTLIDGAVDLQTALISILAMARGKVVRTSGAGVDPQVYAFYKDNDSSVAFTVTVQADSSGRTN